MGGRSGEGGPLGALICVDDLKRRLLVPFARWSRSLALWLPVPGFPLRAQDSHVEYLYNRKPEYVFF